MDLIKQKNRLKGNIGEDFAAEYLRNIGWTILERNWHYSRHAEIDIIAKDGDTIVFVEVKTRSSLAAGHPFEAIDMSKLKKIQMAALSYINEIIHESKTDFRIDIVAVVGTKSPKIELLSNVSF